MKFYKKDRTLFSRRTMSSCSLVSSNEAFKRKNNRNVYKKNCLRSSNLQAESLSGEVAALRVAGVQLGVQVIRLRLPLTNHLSRCGNKLPHKSYFYADLVEVLAPLLGDDRRGVGALVLHGHVLELSLHPHLAKRQVDEKCAKFQITITFDFSADPILALSASICSSASETLELSLA